MTVPALASQLDRYDLGKYVRLSAMLLIESAILAVVVPVLSIYMDHVLGFSARQMSWVYAMSPIAAILVPLLVGQIADRHLSAQHMLIGVNVLRAGGLLLAAYSDDFTGFLLAMTLVACCQIPSTMLGAAVAFHHLPDARRYGGLRFWGALGWILMVWVFSFHLDRFPGESQAEHTRDCFLFAAFLAAAYAAYALTLPGTPPSRGRRRAAVLDALSLLKQRSFVAIALGAWVMGAAMPFYFVLTGLYFIDPVDGLGITVAQASRASTAAQSLELVLFPLLALALRRFGVRWVLLLGLLAWPLRFAALMIGAPAWLVIGAQALHGFNVVFWMTAAKVAVDLLAQKDIRASAQGLYSMLFAGAGALSGQLLVGVVYGHFTDASGRHDWLAVFFVPFAFTSLGALCFWLLFQRPADASGTLSSEVPAGAE